MYGTCTLHFSSSITTSKVSSKLIPLIVSVFCSGQNIRKFSETAGPTEAIFHVAPPWDRGKAGKLFQMIKVNCCYSLLSTPGGGAFSRDFTTNLTLQCRALKIEKLKKPLFRGPEDIHDWCITSTFFVLTR